jgi:hypothetical protein
MLMCWVLATVVGSGCGILMGVLAERLPFAPVLRSVLAAVAASLAVLVASMVTAALWMRRSSGHFELAFGYDIEVEGLAAVATCIGIVAALHVLVGRFAAGWPRVARHRPILFGIFGGLWVALPVAWALVTLLWTPIPPQPPEPPWPWTAETAPPAPPLEQQCKGEDCEIGL